MELLLDADAEITAIDTAEVFNSVNVYVSYLNSTGWYIHIPGD